MTLKSGTGQACAACKFQRRRCTPQCLLAPFFPADQSKIFQNVHRLFGVKHIQKLLKELDPDQRAKAMNSIKYHAAMRERHPVYGCLAEIQILDYQIQLAEEELRAVLQQLVYYRQQHQQEMSASPVDDDYLSQLQLGMAPPGNLNMSLVQQDNQQECDVVTAVPFAPHGSSCSNNSNGDFDDKNSNDDDDDALWMQQAYSYSNNNNVNSMVMQSQLTTSQSMPITQGTTQDYNEMHSFFENIDDREVYESRSSLESSVGHSRQSVEQITENELKSAAACFSLTSFN